jgi:hypothetical protein
VRNRFLEEFQLLAGQFLGIEGDPGCVPAGPSEARDESLTDWIRECGHHDRDRAGRLLCRPDAMGRACDDHVHWEPNQIRRQRQQALQFTLGVPVLDEDARSGRPAEVTQTALECLPLAKIPGRGLPGRSTPTRGIFVGCCAGTATDPARRRTAAAVRRITNEVKTFRLQAVQAFNRKGLLVVIAALWAACLPNAADQARRAPSTSRERPHANRPPAPASGS